MSFHEHSFQEEVPANVAVLKINSFICIFEVLGLHLETEVNFLIFISSKCIFHGR